jgi:hypothetical protein
MGFALGTCWEWWQIFDGAGLPVSESTRRLSSEVEKTHPYKDWRKTAGEEAPKNQEERLQLHRRLMLVLRLVMRVLMLMLVMLVLVLVLMLMLVLSTGSFGRAARSDGHAHGDAVGVRVSLHVWVDMRMSRRLALVSRRRLWDAGNMLVLLLVLYEGHLSGSWVRRWRK